MRDLLSLQMWVQGSGFRVQGLGFRVCVLRQVGILLTLLSLQMRRVEQDEV